MRLAAIGVLLVGGAVIWKLWAAHPSGWVPACPTWRVLGVYCPGCGSTRSVHHLLNGRPIVALRHNAMMVLIGVPAGAVYAWGWLTLGLRGRRARVRVLPRALCWGIVVVVIVFTLLRNVPVEWVAPLRPPDAHGRTG